VTPGSLTVGVVTPHTAAGPEVELPAMTGGRVATVVHRTSPPRNESPQPSSAPSAHAELRASTGPDAAQRAASTFAGTTLDAVVHASTTTGYLIGHVEEAVLVERLTQRFDVPAVASCAAVVAALRTYGVEHVQLVHPPWFTADFDDLAAAYFGSQGFDVMVSRAAALPRDPADIDSHSVIDWVEHHVKPRAEAVFLAGNGFRAAGAVEEVELRTGRLVLQANQVLLWGILGVTGTAWDLAGHGRLLEARDATPRPTVARGPDARQTRSSG
jgi:maleate isomerase